MPLNIVFFEAANWFSTKTLLLKHSKTCRRQEQFVRALRPDFRLRSVGLPSSGTRSGSKIFVVQNKPHASALPNIPLGTLGLHFIILLSGNYFS